MEKSPRSYTLLQCSVFQHMHHSQRDARSKSFIRRSSQDHFLRIQNLYRLGIIQKHRNNWKQENLVRGLMYKTVCKRQDGLHKMMSSTYLSPTDTWDWMLATWKAGRKRQGWTHSNTHTVVGKGRTELNSGIRELAALEQVQHLITSSSWSSPEYASLPTKRQINVISDYGFDIVDFN